MVEIVYCDGCGKRIREGDGKSAVEGKVFCSPCGAKAAASTAQHPIPADITARASGTAKAESQSKVTVPPRRSTAISPKSQKEPNTPEPTNNKTVYIAAGAGGLVLMAVLFVVFGKSEPQDTKKAAAATPAEKTASPPPPPSSALDPKLAHAPAAQTPTPDAAAAKSAAEEPGSSIEDIREGYARRKLDDLTAKEKAKSIAQETYRTELQGLVSSHGSTRAGKVAAELLKNLPHSEPKPETKTVASAEAPKPAAGGPYKTLFRWSGDAGSGAAAWTRGSKDEKNASEGKAYSWQSESATIGWFTLVSTINLRDQNVKLSKDSWIRVHYKLSGGHYLCFHSAIGSQILEKHFAKLPEDKWAWLGFKIADFTRDIRTNAPPKDWAGANWLGTTIYSHTDRKPGILWIDEVVIGDGPLPANDAP